MFHELFLCFIVYGCIYAVMWICRYELLYLLLL